MDDGALRDAGRGVHAKVLPAGHDLASKAAGAKLTKKVRGQAVRASAVPSVPRRLMYTMLHYLPCCV